MTDTRQFSLSSLDLRPGEHFCALYCSEQERDTVLLPYLREGLMAGDKCLVAVHDNDSATLLDSIRESVDVPGSLASKQLEIRTGTDPLLDNEEFSIDEVIAFWDDNVRTALEAGYPYIRLGAEASWWMPQLPGTEELVRYESELNRFAARYPQVILCMYDLRQYSESVVLDLLKTHPRVLLCGMLLENPYYLEPDEFLAARQRHPASPAGLGLRT
jgi:hypothetical protein